HQQGLAYRFPDLPGTSTKDLLAALIRLGWFSSPPRTEAFEAFATFLGLVATGPKAFRRFDSISGFKLVHLAPAAWAIARGKVGWMRNTNCPEYGFSGASPRDAQNSR